MLSRNTRFLIPALALGLTLGAGVAESGVVTFDYTVEYTGGTAPMGTPPWLRATFSDMGPNQVKLKLEAPGLVGDEFVTKWLFNVNPTLDPDGLVLTHTGGLEASDIDAEADGINPGGFDLLIRFPSRNNEPGRFFGGLWSEYLIEWSEGGALLAQSFSFTAAGNRPLLAGAHVQGIAGGTGSGWVTPSQPETPVPEPGTLLLIGSGLLGLAARRRRARP